MRGRSRGESADARGGRFVLLPHCLVKSDAYRTASYRAKAALVALAVRHSGFNNGKITMSAEELAESLNCRNYGANSKAVAELIARGMVVLEKDYPMGARMAREYRLTFVSVGSKEATHDYLSWIVGDAGTVKKRVVANANETPSPVAVVAKDRKSSSVAAADETNGTGANPPKSVNGSVAVIAAHIGNHVGVSASVSKGEGETADGHRSKANGRRFGQQRVSAAPPAEELRQRSLAFIAEAGRGSQGRLAATAQIPVGTFCKFIRNGGPLNEQARIRLACSFPKAETAERLAGVGR